jgi:hypothetical protein
MLFYMRGRLPLDDRLIVDFFRAAPSTLRSSALRFVGRSLYQIVESSAISLVPVPSEEVVARGVALWEYRARRHETDHEDAAYAAEMSEFGWWFPAPSFDHSWAFDQLLHALRVARHVEADHLVVMRLAEMASGHTARVLQVLQLMMDSDHSDWIVIGHGDAVMEILRTALSSEDGAIHRRAEELTNLLGARGYRQFRVLLRDTTATGPTDVSTRQHPM